MHRVLFAGTHSGCGKTTVSLAVICALKARGHDVSAFKCGPDYIDPMFHQKAVGIPSYNLDPFFCNRETLRALVAARGREIAVIEGVMGYYDGVGHEGQFSTYDVARHTDTPVVLVIDVQGMYASAGAILKGFLKYRQGSNICGVLFNNASAGLYEGLKTIAQNEGIQPLGYFPRAPDNSIQSRHLGLIAPDEMADIHNRLLQLGKLAEQHIDLDGVLMLAKSASPITDALPYLPAPADHVRVAVARDAAFSFLYQENLEYLEALGCELVYFSPLCDAALPDGIGGLYLCGGYPELYLRELSANAGMRRNVREAIRKGLPTIAECGGYLYLHDTLDGVPMAGVIPADAYRTNKLQRFGYTTLTADENNLLCGAGGSIRAHEFHYYATTDDAAGFTAQKPAGGSPWACARATDTFYAGFPHLYFYANPSFAQSFVRKAVKYATI